MHCHECFRGSLHCLSRTLHRASHPCRAGVHITSLVPRRSGWFRVSVHRQAVSAGPLHHRKESPHALSCDGPEADVSWRRWSWTTLTRNLDGFWSWCHHPTRWCCWGCCRGCRWWDRNRHRCRRFHVSILGRCVRRGRGHGCWHRVLYCCGGCFCSNLHCLLDWRLCWDLHCYCLARNLHCSTWRLDHGCWHGNLLCVYVHCVSWCLERGHGCLWQNLHGLSLNLHCGNWLLGNCFIPTHRDFHPNHWFLCRCLRRGLLHRLCWACGSKAQSFKLLGQGISRSDSQPR